MGKLSANMLYYGHPRRLDIREAVTAIERWEPRVDLLNVNVITYQPSIAGLTVTAEWRVGNFESRTEVNVIR